MVRTPCTGQNKKTEHQRFFPSLLSRPPPSRLPRHRFGPGKAFLILCDIHSRRPPRVKYPAITVAVVRQLDSNGTQTGSFLVQLERGRYLAISNDPCISYVFCRKSTRRPDSACSCIHRVSRHTRRLGTKVATALLATPPFIRQLLLTPATATGPPSVPCSEYTHAHEEKYTKRNRRLRVPKENKWRKQ